MHLAPASVDPQLMLGEILQHSIYLIVSIKNNHVLVEQFFHTMPLAETILSITVCNLEILSIGKYIENSLHPCWKGHFKYC